MSETGNCGRSFCPACGCAHVAEAHCETVNSGREPVVEREVIRALSKLMALWPCEIEFRDMPAHDNLLNRVRGALAAERARAVAGHWSYDVARHLQLLRLFARLEGSRGR